MESYLKRGILAFSVLLTAILSGCREFETETVIRPDGSCERSVSVTRDSDDSTRALEALSPLAPGAGWTLDKTETTSGGPDVQGRKRYVYKLKQDFRRVRDLDRLLNPEPEAAGPKLAVSVKLDRKFRWFNTLYEYRETYEVRSFFRKVLISDFMTRGELDLYYQNEDTLHLKEKSDAWFMEGYTRFVINRLCAIAETRPLAGLDAGRILAESDTLKSLLTRNMTTLMEDSTALAGLLESSFRHPRFSEWKGPIDSIRVDIQRTLEVMTEVGSDSYLCRVRMPGLIMDTNATSVEGSRAEWKFEGERCQMEPYEMHVESRVLNRWALWVTGLLVLAALAALVAGTVWRR